MNVKDVGGKLLVICRTGCSIQEILDATGMPWSVLFEEKPYAYQRAVEKAFPAADVLEALNLELWVIAIIAGDIKKKREVNEEDYARLQLAIDRVQAARAMTLGEPIYEEVRAKILKNMEKPRETIGG